jgi:hypothetical protein
MVFRAIAVRFPDPNNYPVHDAHLSGDTHLYISFRIDFGSKKKIAVGAIFVVGGDQNLS